MRLGASNNQNPEILADTPGTYWPYHYEKLIRQERMVEGQIPTDDNVSPSTTSIDLVIHLDVAKQAIVGYLPRRVRLANTFLYHKVARHGQLICIFANHFFLLSQSRTAN